VGVGFSARGVGLALAAGVRQLLPSKRETAVTRSVAALLDNKGDDEAFGYLDPKLGATDSGAAAAASRSRAAYSQAIVFIAGPGNYLEYQAVRQRVSELSSAPGASKVVYGCTEVLTPPEFLSQLAPRANTT